jgi:hypothetical protein
MDVGMVELEQNEPQTLFFERSPRGNCDAIVECDQRTVYFYLFWPGESHGVPCWLANLLPPPLTFDRRELEANLPPLLPKPFIRKHEPEMSQAMAQSTEDDWRVLWDPAGQGALLYFRDLLVAIAPPWSGQDSCGMSLHCALDSMVCRPFPSEQTVQTWQTTASEYWDLWRNESHFSDYQQRCLAQWQTLSPAAFRYYAIDGGKFPPRAVANYRLNSSAAEPSPSTTSESAAEMTPEWKLLAARWHQQSGELFTTVGLGLNPQPTGDWTKAMPDQQFRIELSLFLPPLDSEEERQEVVKQLGGLAEIPWKRNTCFRPGDTCEIRWQGQRQTCRIEATGATFADRSVQLLHLELI